MNTTPGILETPVSYWVDDSDGTAVTADLVEVQQHLKDFEPPEDEDMLTVPMQQGDPASSSSIGEVTRRMTSLCANMQNRDGPETRRAPTKHAVDQNVNTIEVVKHKGRYSVVLDGVRQREIKPKENNEFETERYWMPRFKESRIPRAARKKTVYRTHDRVVGPVVVAMRLEKYETPPESCEVEVLQSIVGDGQVVMHDTTIFSVNVTPYSASETNANAVLLPYPVISTPSPYFVVNDYSKLREAENLARTFLTQSTYKSYFDMAKDAMTTSIESIKKLLPFTRVAASATLLGRQYAALQLVNELVAFRKSRNVQWSEQNKSRFKEEVIRQAKLGPMRHFIKLSELSTTISRITESVVDGEVGKSENEMQDMGRRKEAALRHFIYHGEGQRDASERDEISGLYSEAANDAHANNFDKESNTTRNTISVAGMSAAQLSSTRVHFSFVIRIVEQDKSVPAPTIRIDATHINGMDAGYVAAGVDSHIDDAVQACDCLVQALSTLSVKQFLRKSENVEDSDLKVVDELVRETTNDSLKRKQELAAANAKAQEDLQKATEEFDITKRKMSDCDDKINNVVFKERKERRDAEAKFRGSILRSPDNMSAHVQTRNSRLTRIRRQYLEDMATLTREKGDLSVLLRMRRRRKVQLENYASAITSRNSKYGSSEVDETPLQNFKECVDQFKASVIGSVDFWNDDNFILSDEKSEKVRKHACLNLGVKDGALILNEFNMVRRVAYNYGKREGLKNETKCMRFSALVVPMPNEWQGDAYVYNAPGGNGERRLLRTLPQVVRFERRAVSNYGRVYFFTPKQHDESKLQQRPLVASAVHESRKSIARISQMLHTPALQIRESSRHFCQRYVAVTSISTLRSGPRRLPRLSRLPIDMTSACMLPAVSVAKMIVQTEASGRESLQSVLALTSGLRLHGVGQLLSDVGVGVEVSSFVALAAFSEIVSYHFMERSTFSVDDSLCREELVKSALSRAKQATYFVADFIESTRVKDACFLHESDVSFDCIPGLWYVRIALRHLGVGEAHTAFSLVSRKHAHCFSVALRKLASNPKLPLHRLPFTCVQSVGSVVPSVISDTVGTYSTLDAHLAACATSFGRIKTMLATTLKPNHTIRNFKHSRCTLLVDVVCTYPIVLKAVHVDEAHASAVVSSAVLDKKQSDWEIKYTRISADVLAHRMASLRLEIWDETKHEAALKTTEVDHASKLVVEMNELSERHLTTYMQLSKRATYMVPYGSLLIATTKDIAHVGFEMRPVWIESLAREVANMKLYPYPYNTDRSVQIQEVYELEEGHQIHPYMMQLTESGVRLYLERWDASRQDENDYEHLDLKSASVINVCKEVNSEYQPSSGRSQLYAATMHNAERLFQTCTMVTSLIPSCLHAVIRPEHSDARHVVGCSCLANSLCDTGIGSSVRIAVATNSQDDASGVLLTLRGMCEDLTKEGVKAVPFREMCMVLSIL